MFKRNAIMSVLSVLTAIPRAGSTIQYSYATQDEIPSAYVDLYSEQAGKWVLTGVTGIKTQADVDRVQEALRKEREDHKKVKELLSTFSGLDPEEVRTKLDRLEELELANGGKLDEQKINEIAEARVRAKVAPLERQVSQLSNQLTEKEKLIGDYTQREKLRTIHDQVRKAATNAKLRDTAIEDVLIIAERVLEVDEAGNVVARDGVGVTPGITPDVWLTEQQEKRPHWWPESTGAGAKGGSGGSGGSLNPFSHEGWNMTQQAVLYKADPAKAEQLARLAGTTVGGGRPVKK